MKTHKIITAATKVSYLDKLTNKIERITVDLTITMNVNRNENAYRENSLNWFNSAKVMLTRLNIGYNHISSIHWS